ncbi:glycogen/starch synthase, partial [Candidatus Woesearchaeota archaeon]|nr:glycogen/starch synthase [Candidatus Woesearchaeota archaeon]
MSVKAKADILFEVSWEVCNKVGGINTVIKSKVQRMQEHYPDYILIGPYFKDKADIELKEEKPPNEMQEVFNNLAHQGIVCHYGSWAIRGDPKVILIEFTNALKLKDEIKTSLWNEFAVESLLSKWEFEEPMIWAWCAGMLLEQISGVYGEKKIVMHGHEWLAGSAILYLKMHNNTIKTVFTTHATILGRSIAGSGNDLYSILPKIEPYKEAEKHNIKDKFTMELAVAQNTDIFTTVSEITSIEAEKILGRKADVLVLNGLDSQRFPTIEETSLKHHTCLERIREFITYHFFPYYSFDLEHNLIFFTVARYEFQNKGMDVIIDALARLNDELKAQDSDRSICMFFWIPMETKGIKTELLENKSYYRQISSFVHFKSDEILRRIVDYYIAKQNVMEAEIFTKDFIDEIERNVMHFKRKGNPLIVTHNIDHEESDPILTKCRQVGLDNKEDDKIKVILYPVMLDGSDHLINLPYYDAIAGSHLGLFPSLYEPWGYTPLESGAMGVPAVTSDVAGFGRFIKPMLRKENPGIFVIERYNKSYDEVVEELKAVMVEFSNFDKNNRVENKINAKHASEMCDWS